MHHSCSIRYLYDNVSWAKVTPKLLSKLWHLTHTCCLRAVSFAMLYILLCLLSNCYGTFCVNSIRLQLYSNAPSENKGAVPTSMDVLAFQGKYGPQKTLYPLQKPLAELMDVSVKPVDHRNYAFIWFSLSASTAALGLRAIKKGKVGRGHRWDKVNKDIISCHDIISHLVTDTWCLLN